MHKPDLPSRRALMRALYAADMADETPSRDHVYQVRQSLDDHGPVEWTTIAASADEIGARLPDIDAHINDLPTNWRLERMAAVDRNLLRLGIFEILFEERPAIITIDALVEVAKEFGSDSTSAFINGQLDQLCQDHGIAIRRR